MSDSQNGTRHDIARPKNQAIFYIIIAVLAGLVFSLWFRYQNSSELTKENAEAREKLANLQEKLAELEAAESLRNQETQARKSQSQRLLDQVATTDLAVQTLADEVSKWQSAQRDLTLSDEGKRLAADATLLQQYRALCEQPRKSPEIPQQLRRRLEGLKAQAEEAAKRPNLPINPQFASEIAAVETEAAAALKDYRDANDQLQVLRAQAPKTTPTGGITLEASLTKLKEQEAAQRLALLNKELQKTRDEEDAKEAKRAAEEERRVRELKAEAERKENERKRELLRLQSDQRVQSLDHEIQSATAKKDKERLESEFQKDLPEIRSLLKPYISDGSTQPQGRHFARIGGKPSPVSLGRLQASGALQPTDAGQRTLYGVTSANRLNDRDLGAFPTYFGGEDDWRAKAATVQRAQELLIKYGNLMVEKGMLAP